MTLFVIQPEERRDREYQRKLARAKAMRRISHQMVTLKPPEKEDKNRFLGLPGLTDEQYEDLKREEDAKVS